MKTQTSRMALRVAALAAIAALTSCNTLEKLSEVGEPPKTSAVQDPTKAPGYQPVSMPMPAPTTPSAGVNSLWRPGARDFLKDQRASEVGDIITVQVSQTDAATLNNNTKAVSANSDDAASGFVFLGLENSLHKILPSSVSPTNLFSFGSTSTVNGTGTLQRNETVTMNVAAMVTQKLPNGNLVISGSQEMRVNSELRQVSIQGIIRPQDIASGNTINSDQIAEARIVYGGRGTLSDVQSARWGQQLWDDISPF
ncbi:MAG TPA: flagellar basal body L-ring protein FlgH [Magnetospirillaceae bacterium]